MRTVTIYNNPTDFPGRFVARSSRITRRRKIDAAVPLAVTKTLKAARAAVMLRFPGLVCLARAPGDDPKIVEVWL